ncbi:MAG: TIGR03085 family metal-binding protein [Lapillicoccus sp.]
MTGLAQQERHALCDTLLKVGPDAPTLCSPWRARDLAAHLVIRDSRPDLALGMFVPALKGRLDAAMTSYASGAWPQLVDRVRSGPPRWSPTRLAPLDEAVNLAEFFIHHEDVLRGAPGFTRRVLDAPLEAGIWKGLKSQSTLMLRKATVGVVLVAPGFGRFTAKGPRGAGTAVVTGSPGELSLFVAGRQRVADVALEGPEAAVAAIAEEPLGT